MCRAAHGRACVWSLSTGLMGVREFVVEARGAAPLLEAFQLENSGGALLLAHGEHRQHQAFVSADDLDGNDVDFLAGLFLELFDSAFLAWLRIYLFDAACLFHLRRHLLE